MPEGKDELSGALRGRIAVTGASGFIGTHLVSALSEAGYEVVHIVEPGVTLSDARGRIVVADICTDAGMSEIFRGADAVVHLAARNHVLKETARDPLAAYRRVNVEGTRNVLSAAVRASAKFFIHVSSVKAMGEGSGSVLDEGSPCAPGTPYGVSKLESEKVVREDAQRYGMRAAILRLPMVYGPWNRGNLPRLIRWADRGLPFPVFRPDNLRSMAYVGNVVAGILALLKARGEGVETYLLKDRMDYPTREVYSAICRALRRKPLFFPVPAPFVRLGGMLSEDFRKMTGDFRVSTAKIEREIGFVPPFTLEEGIGRTVEWYRHSIR
jgi:nucleoside-diphosphate-sugar epimerase